jgi:hypothetical protein
MITGPGERRDPRSRIERCECLLVEQFELGLRTELAAGPLVLIAHPRESALGVDLLQPEIRIDVDGGRRSGRELDGWCCGMVRHNGGAGEDQSQGGDEREESAKHKQLQVSVRRGHSGRQPAAACGAPMQRAMLLRVLAGIE